MSDSEQRTHHAYSPSTLQSLEACPCYIGQQSETPHERTTAGSRAHNVVESGEDDNRLDDADALAAAECIDFIAKRRQLMEEARTRAYFQTGVADGKEYSPTAVLPASAIPEIVELKEIYLPIDDLRFDDAESTTAGYVDEVLIDHTGEYAELMDWKFGRWAVESADNNLQGIAYSLGLFRMYPKLKSVIFWFKQPHLDTVSSAVFTREQVPALYLRVQVVVARAREARKSGNFSTARPMVPACNFCANIGSCPAVAAFACRVGSKFHPVEIPDDITPTQVLSGRNATLGMRLSQVMAVWAKAFRTQITNRVICGEADIPAGYEVRSQSKREIIDADKFKQVVLRYLPESEYNALLAAPGFGDIENIIKERAPRGSKKSALEEFQQQLEDSGAVAKQQPYSFLRAVTTEEKQTKT